MKIKIKNPLTNRLVSLSGTKGKELIKKYITKMLTFTKEDEEKIIHYLAKNKKSIGKPKSAIEIPAKLSKLLKTYIKRFKEYKNVYSTKALKDFCIKNIPITQNNINYSLIIQLNYDIWDWNIEVLDSKIWPKFSSFDPHTHAYIGKSIDIRYNSLNYDFFLRFLQKEPKQTITINDIIDPDWFRSMNTFLDNLSRRQRFIIFGYTNNSHFHVNPYLNSKNGPGDYEMKRFYTWYKKSPVKLNPFFYQLLDLCIIETDILVHPEYEQNLETCRDPSVDLSLKYRIIHDLSMTRSFRLGIIEKAYEAFIIEFQDIIMKSPRLQKDMVVYRGTSTDYFLKGSNNRTYKNTSFISCTISVKHAIIYMRYQKCCLHRLLIPKGTHMLFVGGNTVYKNELEFVLPMNSLYTNLQTRFVRGYEGTSTPLCPTSDSNIIQITDTIIYS